MAGTTIVTDSACDLPEALIRELGVDVVPLTIRFGTEELVDRVDLSPAEFWARCGSSPTLPETAAPSPGAFGAAFQRAADAGADGVVCVCLSSALSATYQAARTAAVDAPIPVRVVDSLSLSLGEGLLVTAASRAALAGKSTDDVAGLAEDLVGRSHLYGTLNTLDYLKKGGRIGASQALLGSMLSIKPVVVVQEGAIHPESRQRTRARALQYLVDKVRQAGDIEALGVMNGGAADIDQLVEPLTKLFPADKIIVGDLGAVIGAHTGPGTVGVCYQLSA
jgi:DegV family protein with EDD domain